MACAHHAPPWASTAQIVEGSNGRVVARLDESGPSDAVEEMFCNHEIDSADLAALLHKADDFALRFFGEGRRLVLQLKVVDKLPRPSPDDD